MMITGTGAVVIIIDCCLSLIGAMVVGSVVPLCYAVIAVKGCVTVIIIIIIIVIGIFYNDNSSYNFDFSSLLL